MNLEIFNTIRNVEELLSLIQQGHAPKYLFFWGHTAKTPGVIDQSCFSNWFPARFVVNEIEYPTTEHYMMAEKARLFHDLKIAEKVLSAKSPGEAKKLGRQVQNFDEETWKAHRFQIVVDGNYAKFSQNNHLESLLLTTGGKVLVEAAPNDRIWGIGLGRDSDHSNDPTQWRGLNLLGFALMEARQRLLVAN